MRPLHLPSPFACPQTPSTSMSTNFAMMRGGGGDETSMHVHHFHHHFGGGGSSSSIGSGLSRPALPMPTQTPTPPAPAPTGPGGHQGHDGRPNITVPISQVLNFLYLGSRREASDKAQLKSLSVGFVLNMTADVPNYFPDSFQYQQVPILDTWNQHIQEYFEVAFEFINQARSEGKAVLVHCSAGISRSAAIVIGYLMKEFSMSLNDAHQFVRSRRDIISPNLDFMGELTDFETRLLRDRELEKRPVISTAPAISSALSHGPVA